MMQPPHPHDTRVHTAQTVVEETFDESGKLVKRKTTTDYSPEILSIAIGLCVIAVTLFVGFGRLPVEALVAVIGAVSGVVGVVKGRKKIESGDRSWLPWVSLGVGLLALLAAGVALYWLLA
jgi:hypothetical protein